MKKYSVIWIPCEGTVDNPTFFNKRQHAIGSGLNRQDAINLYNDELRSHEKAGGEIVEMQKNDSFFKINDNDRIFEYVGIFEQ